ncbi:MAG: 6-pyruvoyl trahydropterin synthase family protein, partial [Bacteroidia bacterium]
YKLTVGLKGIPDAQTGYLADTKWLSALIQRQVIDYMDHRNLNLDIEEFKILNPTVENIACVIYNRLRPFIENTIDLKIELYETERNRAEYPATW